MKKFFIFAIPLCVVLVPFFPRISVTTFQLSEPTFLNPIKLPGPITIRQDPYGSGLFGAKRNGGRQHQGVDLLAAVGTEVRAAKSGIALVGRIHNGMGRYIEIWHPDGSMTRYGHLHQIWISDHERVKQGQTIGTVGKSGNARRKLIQPHLHFEVWDENATPHDPLPLITPEQKSVENHS